MRALELVVMLTHVSTLILTSMPASMPAPVSYLKPFTISLFYHLPTFIFYPKSPAILLSCHLLAPAESAAFSSFCHIFISHYRIPALLSPLSSILGLFLPFGSSLLKIFKHFLSDKP